MQLFSKICILEKLMIEKSLGLPQDTKWRSFRTHIHSENILCPKLVLRPLNHIPVLVSLTPHVHFAGEY